MKSPKKQSNILLNSHCATSMPRRAILTALSAAALMKINDSMAFAYTDPPGSDPTRAFSGSILDFIPQAIHEGIFNGTNKVDLAQFIEAAIVAGKSRPGGVMLYFPPGEYLVSGIDATNNDPVEFSWSLRLVGSGPGITRICAGQTDAIMLNAAGRNNLQIESLSFVTGNFQAQTAILLSRTKASPNCNNSQFRNVTISGNYRIASVVTIAAESQSWVSCRFMNSNPNANHHCLYTSFSPASVPDLIPGKISLVSGPNTDNVMIDCEFYAPFPDTQPIIFHGSAAYSMQSCSIIAGDSVNARLVTYRPTENIFTGPVTWFHPHFEVFGRNNVVHWLDIPRGVSYFRGLNSYSGYYVIDSDTSLLDFSGDSRGKQPVLQTSIWTAPLLPQGQRNILFRIFGVSNSEIALGGVESGTMIEVSGFSQNSRLDKRSTVIDPLE